MWNKVSRLKKTKWNFCLTFKFQGVLKISHTLHDLKHGGGTMILLATSLQLKRVQANPENDLLEVVKVHSTNPQPVLQGKDLEQSIFMG